MALIERCRENFDRSILVDAEIDENLHRVLTPKILRLRKEDPDRPITVYVDSIGGSPEIADAIINILTASDADGRSPSVVTVVTRLAASAAANLLTYGDYVIAYPNTTIYFHGLRYAQLAEATFERATSAARSLKDFNETRALALANRAIERLLFLYAAHRQLLENIQAKNPQTTIIEAFVQLISAHLSPHARRLCQTALQKYFELQRGSSFAFANANWGKDASSGTMDCTILKAFIDYRLERNEADPNWNLDDNELESMLDDFRVILDYSGGYGSSHREAVKLMARKMGKFLLSSSQTITLDQLPDQSDDARTTWIVKTLEPVLRPVWFFTVSVCRLLQLNENPLTAVDAYWLGIVNEVLGQNWPTIRAVYESMPSNSMQPTSPNP